ncbi:hypothetical protein HPP92_000536 [Vanilla planifolia]|uniref:Uncharacterized protein n=1 Tax=Vanilla planifolia TaxID=51239 RepID=A0A835RYA3_VANPL|nr:hypothetical protein HPP92_000536 [Vanilla planifolia]
MESAGWGLTPPPPPSNPISACRRRSSSLALESYVRYLLFSDFGNSRFRSRRPLKDCLLVLRRVHRAEIC